MKMKTDIDTRYGERIIQECPQGGYVRFYREIYTHPTLGQWIGYPVIVSGYGYGAVDIYLIKRKSKKGWGKGKFLCMIDKE